MAVSNPAAHLRPLTTQMPIGEYLASMWRRRDFAFTLPFEEMRAAHQDTLLGNVWHLFNPALSALVYYLVFGVMLNIRGDIDNYVLWLIVGVFTFGFTTNCVIGGATSITNNQGLMRAIRFPRALLPLAVIVARLMTFGFNLIVIAVVALLTREPISWRWLVLPGIVLVHSALNLGGAFIAARLNDGFRDVQQILPFVFRLLIYISGVMFPLNLYLTDDKVGPVIRWIIEANPLVGVLDLYRWVFLGTSVTGAELAVLGVTAAAILLFGFVFFRGAETRYGRA